MATMIATAPEPRHSPAIALETTFFVSTARMRGFNLEVAAASFRVSQLYFVPGDCADGYAFGHGNRKRRRGKGLTSTAPRGRTYYRL